MSILGRIFSPISGAYFPVHKRIPEILIALLATSGFSYAAPKFLDNAALEVSNNFFSGNLDWLENSTQWLEDNASIWQISATPEKEPIEQVKMSTINNVLIVGPPAALLTFYAFGFVFRDFGPEEGTEDSPDTPDTKGNTPEP